MSIPFRYYSFSTPLEHSRELVTNPYAGVSDDTRLEPPEDHQNLGGYGGESLLQRSAVRQFFGRCVVELRLHQGDISHELRLWHAFFLSRSVCVYLVYAGYSNVNHLLTTCSQHTAGVHGRT